MTSKTSSVKNLLKFTLKKQTPQTLLIAAFALIVCPGMLIAVVNDAALYRSDAYDMTNYFAKFAVAIFIIGIASVIFLLISNLSFLFSKKAGDMYHSLPLTRNELLFARATASYIGAAFIMTLPYAALCFSNSFFTRQIPASTLMQGYLLMLFFLLALTLFTLVFIVVSGGIFDCLIALFSVNMGLPALGFVFVHFYSSGGYGLIVSEDPIYYLSPFSYTVSRFVMFTEGILFSGLGTAAKVWGWAVILLLTIFLIIASALVSFKLFAKRKSETAGDSYSFKFVPIIISTVISAAGGYLIGMIVSSSYTFSEPDFWIFFILGALLCSVLFGVIANRGFKKIVSSLIRGGVAILLTVVIVIGVAFVTKHDVEYLPKAEKVKKIEAFTPSITFTEKEDIDTFVALHNRVIENYKEGIFVKYYEVSEVIFNLYGFEFEYTLDNGKKIKRDYGTHDMYAQNCTPLVLKLLRSDSFFKQYENCVIPNKGLIILSMQDRNEAIPISADAAQKIIDTFRAEMLKADTDIFSEDSIWICIDGKESSNIYIPESFTKTLELVELMFPQPV